MPRSLNKAKTAECEGRDKPASKRGSEARGAVPEAKKKPKPARGKKRTTSPAGEVVRPQGFSGVQVSGNGLSDPQLPDEPYHRIVEAAQEGIWQVGPDDRTVYVNPKICEMTGYKAEEIVGHRLQEFFHPDWQAESE